MPVHILTKQNALFVLGLNCSKVHVKPIEHSDVTLCGKDIYPTFTQDMLILPTRVVCKSCAKRGKAAQLVADTRVNGGIRRAVADYYEH